MTRRAHLAAELRLAARLLAAAAALVVAAIPFALVLLRLLQHGRFAGVDGKLSRRLALQAFRSTRATNLFNAVTDLGNLVALATVVVGITGCLIVVRRRREAAFLVTTAVAGLVLGAALKLVVERARSAFIEPVATDLSKSFPSGHAMNSAFVYGALLIIVLPELRAAARWVAVAGTAGLVTAIGATRVALGMHYISDVIGGAVFGLVWLTAVVWAFSRFDRESADSA